MHRARRLAPATAVALAAATALSLIAAMSTRSEVAAPAPRASQGTLRGLTGCERLVPSPMRAMLRRGGKLGVRSTISPAEASTPAVGADSMESKDTGGWGFDRVPGKDKIAPEAPTQELSPGMADKENFKIDPSVAFWEDFTNEGLDAGKVATTIQSTIESPSDVAYWAYSLGRSAYFIGNAIAGFLFAQSQGKIAEEFSDTVQRGGAVERLTADAIEVYKWNLKWQKEGLFKAPWDMNPRHRQFNPRYIGERILTGMEESAQVLGRRFSTDDVDTKYWMKNKLYPEYYQDTFHYQTDGWLSTRSAETYEHSTETLFIGRQDSMQRTALVPFGRWMKQRRDQGTSEGTPKVLEIAAGTGRFATFLKDSYPEVDLTVSDLSPFYLEQARKNLNYWRRFRQEQSGTPNEKIAPTRFMQAAAEELPVEDASQDCVVSVYLFHELPPEARENVVKEVARVLKKGGKFILTDSLQYGDRPKIDAYIGNFSNFNEPWYESFLKEDFGKLLTKDGLFTCEEKVLSSVTKTLSFTRT